MGARIGDGTIGTVLKFAPRFEERPWGGDRLRRLGRDLPRGKTIGESWEISAIAGRSSTVASSPHQGRAFDALLAEHGAAIVGDVPLPRGARFPLLVKLIDASTALSVQIHPRDEEAIAIEGPGAGNIGKTEAWVILDAEPGAEIIHGFAQGVELDDVYRRFAELRGDRLADSQERELFRWVRVSRGDVVFMPAGTVHALGPGITVLEIQQSSDLTYRLYDWGRRDERGRTRELHLDKARRIGVRDRIGCPHARLSTDASESPVSALVECDHFGIEDVVLRNPIDASTIGARGAGFHILFGWSGESEVATLDAAPVPVSAGEFVLIPAATGSYTLRPATGGARCLRVLGAVPA